MVSVSGRYVQEFKQVQQTDSKYLGHRTFIFFLLARKCEFKILEEVTVPYLRLHEQQEYILFLHVCHTTQITTS